MTEESKSEVKFPLQLIIMGFITIIITGFSAYSNLNAKVSENTIRIENIDKRLDAEIKYIRSDISDIKAMIKEMNSDLKHTCAPKQ